VDFSERRSLGPSTLPRVTEGYSPARWTLPALNPNVSLFFDLLLANLLRDLMLVGNRVLGEPHSLLRHGFFWTTGRSSLSTTSYSSSEILGLDSAWSRLAHCDRLPLHPNLLFLDGHGLLNLLRFDMALQEVTRVPNVPARSRLPIVHDYVGVFCTDERACRSIL
jgi:hypothetical protein